MKRLIPALAAAAVLAGASHAYAAGVGDFFRFEFQAGGPDRQIGTDLYTHHTDFRHYNDYYQAQGYTDPNLFASCRQSWVRDDEGRSIQRITCQGRSSTPGK